MYFHNHLNPLLFNMSVCPRKPVQYKRNLVLGIKDQKNINEIEVGDTDIGERYRYRLKQIQMAILIMAMFSFLCSHGLEIITNKQFNKTFTC